MYAHTKYQVALLPSGGGQSVSVGTATEVGRWSCGYVPHVIRAVGVVHLASAAISATGVYTVSFRTAGAGTSTSVPSATGGQFAAVTVATTATTGRVVYKDGLNQEISPGTDLTADVVTVASGAWPVRLFAWVEPRWEVPGNDTQMIATA